MLPFISGEVMTETFSYRTEREMDITISYRVIENKFGDGYTQTSADGINTKDESYAIRVNAREDKAIEIMEFFDRHKGTKSFLWKAPLGKLSLWTCIDPKPQPQGGGLWLITGTFVKRYSNVM